MIHLLSSITKPIALFSPAVIALGFIAMMELLRLNTEPLPVGAEAQVALVGVKSEHVGTVAMIQREDGVMIAAELQNLPSGRHSISVNTLGKCAPDFFAVDAHSQPDDSPKGLIHPSWRFDDYRSRNGRDLPVILASDDGTARVNFVTDSITLDETIFDSDGSSIVMYQVPKDVDDSNTGASVACGAVQPARGLFSSHSASG